MITKIQILCPANSVSGGPEALHQLCHVLRRKGNDAAILYYSSKSDVLEKKHNIPVPYLGYDIAIQSEPLDEPYVATVIAEVATHFIRHFRRSKKVIWWLSVDNFFRHLNSGASIVEQRECLHMAQSEYAMHFLRKNELAGHYLTDFIPESAFVAGLSGPRPPIVAYNPRKGIDTTEALMKRCGDLPIWLKLEALSQADVAGVLQTAAVYIDFGEHPGRDRLPREASLSGAVVITGKRGAAGFFQDVPLPDRFKIGEDEPDFEKRAVELIGELLSSNNAFDQAFLEQDRYRRWIRRSYDVFSEEVCNFARLLG